MRVPTACRNCRIRKRRCIVLSKGASCTLCTTGKLHCSSALGSSRSSTNILPNPPTLASSQGIQSPETPPYIGLPTEKDQVEGAMELPDQRLCDELVDIYFEMLHDKQHALFHPPTFIAEQRMGKAPVFLVLGMMAIAARFSTNPYFNNIKPWDRGRTWAKASKRLFECRSEAVTLSSIQACALLGNLAFIEGDAGLESLYGAQAIRMVQLMDLPHHLSKNRIQRETEIRVWWTIWMMDTWTSASVDVPRQLTAKADYPRPMEEICFTNLDPGALHDESVDADEDVFRVRESGLWSQMIPLTKIMGEIHVLNKKVVNSPGDRRSLIEEVKKIVFELDYWLSCLPSNLRNTRENLRQYTDYGHGRTFAALHFGYHYHSQLLYYQFLQYECRSHLQPLHTRDRTFQDWAHEYAAKCKEHASQLSNLMWTTNTTAGLECLWAINGHLLVIASSVHLHTLLLDVDEMRLADARRMLEKNFEMLLQMQKYWPSHHLSMSRLKAFHRACQESIRESFDMDQWMIHFLQQYATPASDRFLALGERLERLNPSTPEAWLHAENVDLHTELLSGTSAEASGARILQEFF